MNAKHQFKYTFSESNMEEFSPVEITFEVPGDITIPQMLYNFESYLKACGFYFDGHLEIVDETLNNIDIADEVYGYVADFDKECGCKTTSSPLEKFNEDLSKLEKEVKKNKWVHGICNPPSSDWKVTNNGI